MAKELKRHRKWRLTNDSIILYYFLIFIIINTFFPFVILSALAHRQLPFLIGIVCFLLVLVIFRFFQEKNKLSIQSVFISPIPVFTLFENKFYEFIIVSPFGVCLIVEAITGKFFFIMASTLWLVLFCFFMKNILVKFNENNQLIKKFGTSYLINDSYIFKRGETVGLFFQNDNLIKYTDSILVTLRNIEEKSMKDREAIGDDYPKGKFFSHFEQSKKYNLENNKIGLILEIPKKAGFETEYDAEYPIYWELEVKNEEFGFHHRFIIDIYDKLA